MLVSMILLSFTSNLALLYIAIALVGFGNSNIFPIIFSSALQSTDKKNEISGLMIIGGTIFPILMGFASDAIGQVGAVLVMGVGVLYLIGYTLKIKVN